MYEAKAEIDDLQSLNCARETENLELKNQVTRLIKNNYELAQCLKTFTEDDLKSQRRFDLAPQPPEPGSVHVPPADGHEGKTSSVQQYTVPKGNGINKDPAKSHGGITEEQKGETKLTKKSSLIPHLQKLKRSTQTCAQQQQPKSNKQQQAKRIRQQQQPTKSKIKSKKLKNLKGKQDQQS